MPLKAYACVSSPLKTKAVAYLSFFTSTLSCGYRFYLFYVHKNFPLYVCMHTMCRLDSHWHHLRLSDSLKLELDDCEPRCWWCQLYLSLPQRAPGVLVTEPHFPVSPSSLLIMCCDDPKNVIQLKFRLFIFLLVLVIMGVITMTFSSDSMIAGIILHSFFSIFPEIYCLFYK